MPLDGAGYDYGSEAVRVVDGMRRILDTPAGWCKHALTGHHGAHCLLGAMNIVQSGTEAGTNGQNLDTYKAMNAVAQCRGFYDFVELNNARTTTHADIINFLTEVRARLVAVAATVPA